MDACFDGAEVFDYLPCAEYDAIVLDIMMPRMDGLSVLRELRKRGDATPVLLLTAKDAIEDRVKGLDAGADDYLVKPFAFEELLARLRVLLRKPLTEKSSVLRTGDLELHTDSRRVFRGGEEIRLSAKEYGLLHYMMQNAGVVLSREKLEQACVGLRLFRRFQCDRRVYPLSAPEDRRGPREEADPHRARQRLCAEG